jgi:cytidylate kinase
VLDTWAMAWIYSGTMPMVRLWIESDEDSRTRKCYVSQGTNKTLDMDDCRKLVTKKDTDTRIKFQRRLGFDIFTDRERYDIIFNNTMLIPEATEEVAREGIKVFRKVMLKAVQYCISNIIKPNYDPNNELGRSLIEESNGMITRIRNINNYD